MKTEVENHAASHLVMNDPRDAYHVEAVAVSPEPFHDSTEDDDDGAGGRFDGHLTGLLTPVVAAPGPQTPSLDRHRIERAVNEEDDDDDAPSFMQSGGGLTTPSSDRSVPKTAESQRSLGTGEPTPPPTIFHGVAAGLEDVVSPSKSERAKGQPRDGRGRFLPVSGKKTQARRKRRRKRPRGHQRTTRQATTSRTVVAYNPEDDATSVFVEAHEVDIQRQQSSDISYIEPLREYEDEDDDDLVEEPESPSSADALGPAAEGPCQSSPLVPSIVAERPRSASAPIEGGSCLGPEPKKLRSYGTPPIFTLRNAMLTDEEPPGYLGEELSGDDDELHGSHNNF